MKKLGLGLLLLLLSLMLTACGEKETQDINFDIAYAGGGHVSVHLKHLQGDSKFTRDIVDQSSPNKDTIQDVSVLISIRGRIDTSVEGDCSGYDAPANKKVFAIGPENDNNIRLTISCSEKYGLDYTVSPPSAQVPASGPGK